MLDPDRENKNNEPERKPWSIKDFPVALRQKFVASTITEGTTVPAKLEELVQESLKGKSKK